MERTTFRITACFFLLLAFPISLLATPIHPETKALVEMGQIPPPYAYENSVMLHEMGVDAPMPVSLTGGELDAYWFHSIVLLAQFADQPAFTAPTFYDNMIFTNTPGTLYDYFQEVSYGEFQLVTTDFPSMTGWMNMPMLYSWYVAGQNGLGPYPQNCQKMVEDAVMAADPMVNFAQYDHDGNGSVDGLVLVHAGTDGAWSGSNNDVWSHAWALPTPLWTADGVYISTYCTVPELYMVPGDMTPGVIAHEMGHSVLGLPDLYDTDYSSLGLGFWSLMAYGMWNGPVWMGGSPAHLDAWSRVQATFAAPENVYQDLPMFPLPPVEHVPQIMRMYTQGSYGTEYFLLENREPFGFDTFLPGFGLLIYHIDDNVMTWNNNEWYPGAPNIGHYRVALEQADGLWDLEQNMNFGDPFDPYPGGMGMPFFDVTSWPTSDDYAGFPTQVSVLNIMNPFPLIQADMFVGNPVPPNPPATLQMMPYVFPINIPSNGGSFTHDTFIFNNLATPRTGQLWYEAILPNNNVYYVSQQTITIQPGITWQSIGNTINVPMMAPAGAYQFVAKAGYYPGFVAATTMFPFTKQALVADGTGGGDEWTHIVPGDATPVIESAEMFGADLLPSDFTVGEVWPNPFNAQANVTVALPADEKLTVTLYNTLGQHVSTLADATYSAGQHTFTVDTSTMTSGIYFLNIQTATAVETRKLVLMK